MAFPAAGTPTPNRISFNSGTIDFGASRMVQIDNVTIAFDSTTNPLYVVGSIQPQALVRHSLKYTLTAKVKSIPAEVETLAWGASSGGVTPVEIFPIDGQPTFQNPVVTLFDLNNKQYCYQFINAIWKSDKATAKMGDYAEWDFELDAMNITLLYTT